MTVTWSPQQQDDLRAAAIAWLSARTNDGLDALTSEQINEFTWGRERFRLMDAQRGIRKPRQFTSALSIRTTFRPAGAERPYEDDLGVDGLVRYKWRGDDPAHPENRSLRQAMHERVPLIWFWGVGVALYKPVFPVYLIAEEQREQQFVVATDGLQHLESTGSRVEEVMRRYLRQETYRRLHQPVFRSIVMRAYEASCAVCQLRHSVLLDAAHIVEDRHERGVASVRNGLALCKIHHAAYDAGILGLTPDLRVEVRADILDEIDGPLLEHGIKRLHDTPLMVVPRSRRERPDPELLEIHYERFRAS
ncbi:HNH endonuclease [Dermacoccus abyssi]|uniref:HNH endonuclease n=1 Tax=Dermacoccus abyssi TaxID=322596 RepID=A0ABX5ZBI9_9MICO|nr:HNH endonuclease [Dermacoccus abyssi]